MERIGENKPRGITSAALRTWGLLFLAAGIFSQGILQNRVLGMQNASGDLLALLNQEPSLMTAATAALILQFLEGCAVPIFALLLVEGFCRTKDWTKYMTRVAIAAAVSEIPFDLAMTGKVLDLGSQNPGFAMVLGLLMLFLFRRFSEKSGTHRLIKALVVLAALMWAEMLQIQHGAAFVIIIGFFWLLRNKPQLRGLLGAGVCLCCTMISPYYLVAPMGCLMVHLHNREYGNSNRVANYCLYPAMLLVIWAAATFAF